MAILSVVAAAGRPCSLADLVAGSGQSRATAHRLAVALEAHDLLRRDDAGRFLLGTGLVGLGHAAGGAWPVADLARPVLDRLRTDTGESAQCYVRDGDERVCLVSLESANELRTIVAEGARLPLGVGSAGRLLLGEVPESGWTASVEERATGVASVSAPVIGPDGQVVAALGVSGPIGRLGTDPGRAHGPAVVAAAREVSEALDR